MHTCRHFTTRNPARPHRPDTMARYGHRVTCDWWCLQCGRHYYTRQVRALLG